MDYNQMKAYLNIYESVNVQMPNEIFEDLNKQAFKTFNHKCFAYAYYYLVSYMYRNALYGKGNLSDYGQKKIVSLLVSNDTAFSYIVKRGGLLDQMGYTVTTNNFPVTFYIKDGILDFTLINEIKDTIPDYKHNPRFIVKEPVKALVRFDNEDFTGTYYSFQNTHRIEIEKFVKIITDEVLGSAGLFVYGYLTMMCDKFPDGYQLSYASLMEIIGCTKNTLSKYTSRLEEVGLIASTRKSLGNKNLEKIYRVN